MRKKTLVTQHRSNHKAESEILTSYLCFLRISLFIKFRGESDCQCRRRRRCGFDPWVGKISWRRKGQPTPVILPGKSHGPRSRWATVHVVAKSQTGLCDWAHIHYKITIRNKTGILWKRLIGQIEGHTYKSTDFRARLLGVEVSKLETYSANCATFDNHFTSFIQLFHLQNGANDSMHLLGLFWELIKYLQINYKTFKVVPGIKYYVGNICYFKWLAVFFVFFKRNSTKHKWNVNIVWVLWLLPKSPMNNISYILLEWVYFFWLLVWLVSLLCGLCLPSWQRQITGKVQIMYSSITLFLPHSPPYHSCSLIHYQTAFEHPDIIMNCIYIFSPTKSFDAHLTTAVKSDSWFL